MVAGDHRVTLSTGLLSSCLVLSRPCMRGTGAGAGAAVLDRGRIPGQEPSWAAKLFASSETMQGTLIAGWKV